MAFLNCEGQNIIAYLAGKAFDFRTLVIFTGEALFYIKLDAVPIYHIELNDVLLQSVTVLKRAIFPQNLENWPAESLFMNCEAFKCPQTRDSKKYVHTSIIVVVRIVYSASDAIVFNAFLIWSVQNNVAIKFTDSAEPATDNNSLAVNIPQP